MGSSYLPSDILAAFLYAQLESRDSIQARRKRIWEYYDKYLKDWALSLGVQLPSVPSYCEQPFHMYYLLLPTLELRQKLISHLNVRGINSVFHYQPLHLSNMGREFGGKEGDCPVTEGVSDRLVRLPFYNELNETDQARIVNAVEEFRWENNGAPQPVLIGRR
jgi:dTDP-4-amino-4,6-dideoxygalactose transaminase